MKTMVHRFTILHVSLHTTRGMSMQYCNYRCRLYWFVEKKSKIAELSKT